MLSIGAISFDAGGTLIDPWPSVGHVYAEAVRRRLGFALDPETVTQRFFAAWKSKGRFRYTRREWKALVARTFLDLIPNPSDEALFSTIYEAFNRPGAWMVYSDVHPVLERLRNRGISLAVLSNWDERLKGLLKLLELEAYFDVVILSCETDWQKPDVEIFHHCADCLNLPPEQVLHVGDSEREDMEGARAAGFQCQRILRSAREPCKDNCVRSLSELDRVLNRRGA